MRLGDCFGNLNYIVDFVLTTTPPSLRDTSPASMGGMNNCYLLYSTVYRGGEIQFLYTLKALNFQGFFSLTFASGLESTACLICLSETWV